MATSAFDLVADILYPEEDPSLARYNWRKIARPDQLAPTSEWLIWLILAGRGYGKELCITTPIPVPPKTHKSGWKTLGDLEIGDQVFDEDGKPCRVVSVHDSFPSTAYKLEFSDGTSIDSGGEHQWVTWTAKDRKAFNRGKYNHPELGFPADWPNWRSATRWGPMTGNLGPEIRTTDQLVKSLTYGKRGDTNHSIPTTRPLDLSPVALPLDPWVLGYWLGNGSKSSAAICTHPDDQFFVRNQLDSRGFVASHDYSEQTEKAPAFTVYGLLPLLRSINVLGNKHVPSVYLRASIEQRKDILSGLLDSDGYIGPENSHVEFCSVDECLADAVVELARSLGQKPIKSSGRAMLNGFDHGIKWRVYWRPTSNPFLSPRKAKDYIKPESQALRNHHRMIVSADHIPLKPMRCITVDSPNSMYLVGEGMIPTHNTRTGAEWVKEKAQTIETPRGALVGASLDDVRDTMIEGEALALDTLIPTPTGYKTMGDVNIGDTILDGNGLPCKVTETFPVLYDRPCFSVQLKGGIEIVADGKHKWVTEDTYTRSYTNRHGSTKRTAQVLTTEGIQSTLHHYSGLAKQANHGIRITEAIYPHSELPLDPYLLGAWLGDGTSKTGAITTADPELLTWFDVEGFTPRIQAQTDRGKARTYRLLGLHRVLRLMGLLKNKHVPLVYLRGDRDQRLSLLQGLMDTDGFVSTRGQCEFVNKNKLLADAVVELACSVGIKASAPRPKLTRVNTTHWIVKFTTEQPVFRLERKLVRQVTKYRDAHHWYVKNIIEHESVPVRCIAVDSPDRTYLVTSHYVRTHNSGMLSCMPPSMLRGGSIDTAWNRSMCELFLEGGGKLKGFSSQRPDKLRGPQHHFGWLDEIATLYDADKGVEEESTTMSNLLLGLRLGKQPQLVITGTPKRRRVLVGLNRKGDPDYKPGLLETPGVVITKGSTYDNLDNLAPTFKTRILDMYEGTRTGKQELMAEILDDVEGAMWTQQLIDDHRETHRVLEGLGLVKVVIGVDPALTSGPDSDETGIIIAGVDGMRHGYVLGDRSCRVSPRQWALRIVQAYNEYGADYVVCEKTAGDLLVENLEAVDATMPVRFVSAKVGKRLRASPIANLYEKGVVHHMTNFKHEWESLGRFEDQLTSWIPDVTPDSPDRVDAGVYALSALMINGFLQPAGPTKVKDKRLAGRR